MCIRDSFNIAESSLRKHFKHVRPALPTIVGSSPKPEPLVMVLFKVDLEQNAAAMGLQLADVVFHRLHCERKDIAARSEAEADELMDLMETFATPQEFEEMFGEAADRGAIYVPR